jgi:hypothetical protein
MAVGFPVANSGLRQHVKDKINIGSVWHWPGVCCAEPLVLTAPAITVVTWKLLAVGDSLANAVPSEGGQTIGPHGQPMTVSERIDDMLSRHGEHSPNAQAHPRRGPYLFQAAKRTASRLETRGIDGTTHRIL